MKQQALNHFDITWLPITGLLLFVICFSLYTWWTFKSSNKKHYERISQIPLDEKGEGYGHDNQNDSKEKLHVEPDEKHLLLDHNYDGIQELNHPLPSWWNLLFWLAIVHSVGYYAYYELLGGPSIKEKFDQDYAVVIEKQLEFKKANEVFLPELYAKANTPEGINKGKEVYELNCLPCHGENGKGDIGPNLTDKHWLVASGTPETLYDVIFKGSEDNGMPAWGELITLDEVYEAAAYVMSIKNSFQKGKGAEGKVIED